VYFAYFQTTEGGSRRPKRVHNYPEQAPSGNMPPMQPGMMQPGMPPFQPGMPPMQPGMSPMQPGMIPGMQQGQNGANGGMPGYPNAGVQGYPPQSGMAGPVPMSKEGLPSGKPRSRIDPNQVPSPVVVQENDSDIHGGKTWGTFSRNSIPPLASTDVRYVDEGEHLLCFFFFFL
jgi:protein transport protein SEC24